MKINAILPIVRHGKNAHTNVKMKVSIILPVHDGAPFLSAAIESILDQSFADFELICVDDGSTDQSPDILAHFASRDPRVRIITLHPNVGLPAALNRGFAVAQGQYHSWTSDDNLLRPDMLTKLVAVLDQDAGTDIVHAAYDVIDEAGHFVRHVSVGPAERLMHGNNVGACFLYRAAVTERLGGYDAHIMGAEDYDFWLRAAHHFSFRALDDTLYIYRRHRASLTDQRSRRNHMLRNAILERELQSSHWASSNKERAAILLSMVYSNPWQARFDLLARAARYDFGQWVRSVPAMLRWLYYSVRSRMPTL